ncbi:MAG: hypothetical protein PHQ63_01630 [Smithellaceae bacterium]|nr:hypothetical protein [Smithellaceae bacterium]
MKKIFLRMIFLALVMVTPVSAMADVDVKIGINIPLPPPIVFPGAPEVVVIPETYVYAVPDIDADIFFYGGWWWRPWEGRWYRSRYYDRGWSYYNQVPSFYREVPSGWKKDYRDRRWKGYEWDQRRIPYNDAKKNWRSWKKNRYWEKNNHWGVKEMDRRPPGQQKKYRDGYDGPPRGGAPGPGSKGGPGKDRPDRGGR